MNKRIRNTTVLTLASSLILSMLSLRDTGVQPACKNKAGRDIDSTVPIHPDHIIFVWLENKEITSIIGNDSAPFINSLVKKGTLFTNCHGITHPSYPNYVDFFAGGPNGITDDRCIESDTLNTPNLYSVLKAVGKSFAWYSEDLPYTGSKDCRYDRYVAKHNPTTIFKNVSRKGNKRFIDFPRNYDKLENVVCISPNQVNNMHSGTIKQADFWVRKHLASLAEWCTSHNSVFLIYFDEGESNKDNRIPVIAVGEHVKEGYQADARYDHFSWTKSVSNMFSAPGDWTENVSAAELVTGCWK